MKLYLPWLLGKKSKKIDPSYSPAFQGAKVSQATFGISSIFTNDNAVNFASVDTTLLHQLSTAVAYTCKMLVKLTTDGQC